MPGPENPADRRLRRLGGRVDCVMRCRAGGDAAQIRRRGMLRAAIMAAGMIDSQAGSKKQKIANVRGGWASVQRISIVGGCLSSFFDNDFGLISL